MHRTERPIEWLWRQRSPKNRSYRRSCALVHICSVILFLLTHRHFLCVQSCMGHKLDCVLEVFTVFQSCPYFFRLCRYSFRIWQDLDSIAGCAMKFPSVLHIRKKVELVNLFGDGVFWDWKLHISLMMSCLLMMPFLLMMPCCGLKIFIYFFFFTSLLWVSSYTCKRISNGNSVKPRSPRIHTSKI